MFGCVVFYARVTFNLLESYIVNTIIAVFTIIILLIVLAFEIEFCDFVIRNGKNKNKKREERAKEKEQ